MNSPESEKVFRLAIFPIKSGPQATISRDFPSRLTIGSTGFVHGNVRDRGLVLVDETGTFVSQRGWDANRHRAYPQDELLGQMEVDIQPDHLDIYAASVGQLEIGTGPLTFEADRHIDIFGKPFHGVDLGDSAADFFGRVIGRSVRLLAMDPRSPRALSNKYHQSDASNHMAAADGHPFLWTRQASLDLLHAKLGLPLWTKQLWDFRGNIETTGGMPFVEDYCREVAIGDLQARDPSPCERCPIPNINQVTGETDKLSTKLLTSTRRGNLVTDDPGEKRKLLFGVKLNHKITTVGSVVQTGDPVTITEYAKQPNVVGVAVSMTS